MKRTLSHVFMMGACALLFVLCSQRSFSFSCHDPMPIHQKPIVFDKTRIALTRDYQRTHYGIRSQSIKIKPRLIVLHWTEAPTLRSSFDVFNPSTQSSTRDRRKDLPGNLNVSVHFLVDRNGAIYQLMPDSWMARHVIGLNYYAIGIENVGGVHEKADLTQKQVEANAFLVCYLKQKYPDIREVIGHKDYLKYENTALWLEKNKHYRTKKKDPGARFVRQVKQLIQANCSPCNTPTSRGLTAGSSFVAGFLDPAVKPRDVELCEQLRFKIRYTSAIFRKLRC